MVWMNWWSLKVGRRSPAVAHPHCTKSTKHFRYVAYSNVSSHFISFDKQRSSMKLMQIWKLLARLTNINHVLGCMFSCSLDNACPLFFHEMNKFAFCGHLQKWENKSNHGWPKDLKAWMIIKNAIVHIMYRSHFCINKASFHLVFVLRFKIYWY